MAEALARHDRILRGAIEAQGGYVFKTVGDAFCCAFPKAPDALEAALEVQRTLLAQEWGETGPLRVRTALHTGAAEERDGDYFGPPVNRVARLLSAGHGGQVLLSLSAQELVRDDLPGGAELRDLGERRLKDLFRPERVFQLLSPELPAGFPPLKTLDARANNLPLQPTPLVGREKELEEISGQLRRGGTRLLTLTGPGGTGKTRLALQAAADLLDEFEDGAYFVALAPISDPELVTSAIAGPLVVREAPGQPLMESLKGYLKEKHLLIVLDNFEQVLEAAPLVGELVGTCPNLKVLATARAPLRLYGEREYPVPQLALPDPKILPPLEVLTQYEAIRLFVERATAVKPDFLVTNQSAPAVAEICVRLDGLPLAIELAAARVRLLTPDAMLNRLTNRLELLKGRARNLPVRQQTLRRTIDWSYELLEADEKTLFGRLSVFSGGCTLETIEGICNPERDIDPLEGVEALLENSLLRREEAMGQESRFVMLETVNEYSREKLEESAEAESMKRAHAEYFLSLAEEAEPELTGQDQVEWLGRLEAEHDNMRAALSWALKQGEVELALGLGGTLWSFWWRRGYHSEGRRWLEGALAIDGRELPESRAMALAGLGMLATQQGDVDRVQEASEEGLELLAREGREASGAKIYLLSVSGYVALSREDYERATRLYEECLQLSREMRDDWAIAFSLFGLALVSHRRGDPERTAELYEESIGIFRELGDKHGLAYGLNNLGLVALSQGDLVWAEKLTEESVALLRELGSGGDAEGLCNLGWMALLRDDLGKAADLYEETLTVAWDIERNPVVLSALEGFACLAGAHGKSARAARLWGASQTLRGGKDVPWDADFLAEADARISVVRSGMGEDAWEEASEEGRAMTLEEAVSYALEGEEGAVG